jgi:peptidoglycan/xylan/chitin deacetylase (PgdA/CDA1 family)
MRIKIVGLACVLAASGALAVYAIARPYYSPRPVTQSAATPANVPATSAVADTADAAPSAIPAVQRVAANTPSEPRTAPATAAQPQEFAAPPPPARFAAPACSNPNALGVSRVVEVDTKGGPGFGFEHFKMHDFLRNNEVVLTFDDGPWQTTTPMVLKALAEHCVRATFFPIGKHATYYPDILRQVAEAGHSVGSHTWSHQDLSKKPVEQSKEEIEKGISAVHLAVGGSMSSFFRFPALKHPPEMVTYLGERNVAIFSTDLDSFDFKSRKPEQVITAVMNKLKKHGKGMVLMHDFQQVTAHALPELLNQLKAGGYKIVHMKSKDRLASLPQYDELLKKDSKLPTVSERPTTSVVRTIE